ncbi:MAG: AAA family ATPase [Actinomycetota bacterium]|nr:AAA family ATPase [Actinomycetota bacterium]
MALPNPRGRQSAVVYMPATGHQVILGTAGTGKTVMAMLRAIHLASASTPGAGRVLLVTYNNALVTYLRHLRGGPANGVTVETYGRFARGFLRSRGLMPIWGGILKPNQRRSMVRSAFEAVASGYKPSKFFDRELGFFLDELEWLSGMGITTLAEYESIERHGRKTPLSPSQRGAVWKISEHYRALRAASGALYDWYDIASSARLQIATANGPPRYRHVVIDEGQDLSPEAVRSLAEVVHPEGSVTFFGDYAQQIYGQDLSWRACGLNIRRVERFEDNYRNTAEIARLAIAMSEMPLFGGDPADLVEPRAPRAAGPLPALVECRDEATEVAAVQRLAADFGASGTVAVLARTWAAAERACRGLSVRKLTSDMASWDPTPGIYCGAYHSAKGLEFDAVLMPFCSDEYVPLPDVLAAFGTDEAASREAKLLYVGVTRARTDLVVTYSGQLTPLLPTGVGLWDRSTL